MADGENTDLAAHYLRGIWLASRRGLAAILLFSVFINVLKFAGPIYVLQVIDRIGKTGSVETLVMLTVGVVSAVLAGVSLEAVRKRMFARWGAWLEQQLGPPLIRAGMDGQVRARRVSASEALSDLGTIRQFISGSAIHWLDIVWVPVFLLAAYIIHPIFGAIALAAIGLVLALGVLQARLTNAPRRASRDASRESGEIMTAVAHKRETVGALAMVSNLSERWRRSLATRIEERDRYAARVQAIEATMDCIGRCRHIAVLGIGIWLVLGNQITLGAVIAGNFIIGFTFELVLKAVRRWRALENARRAYSRLTSQLARIEVAATSTANDEAKAPLVLEDVRHRYSGQPDSVFRRLNFTIGAGEILCVIGRSATGKTTLAKILSGVMAPRGGQVRLGEIELRRLPPDKLAKLVGYLPQEASLFEGSVRENIARMSEGDLEQVISAARLVGIDRTIAQLPNGYDTRISEHSTLLSGGERKRIAIARALYGRPRLVVLDEPEANLDGRARRALKEALQSLRNEGSSVVITAQSKRLGRIADKVLRLGDGRGEFRVVEKPTKTDARRDRIGSVEPAG